MAPSPQAAHLALQRSYGNRAVARLITTSRSPTRALRHMPIGWPPQAIFDDWRTAIGHVQIRRALDHYMFTNTNVSDRKLSFEDEVEAAIAIDAAAAPETLGLLKRVGIGFDREVLKSVKPVNNA